MLPGGPNVVCPLLPKQHSFRRKSCHVTRFLTISGGRTQKLPLTPRRRLFAVRHRLLGSSLARAFAPFMVELFTRRHFCRPPGPGQRPGSASCLFGSSPRQLRLNGHRTRASLSPNPRDGILRCLPIFGSTARHRRRSTRWHAADHPLWSETASNDSNCLKSLEVCPRRPRSKITLRVSDRTLGLLCQWLLLHLQREPTARQDYSKEPPSNHANASRRTWLYGHRHSAKW